MDEKKKTNIPQPKDVRLLDLQPLLTFNDVVTVHGGKETWELNGRDWTWAEDMQRTAKVTSVSVFAGGLDVYVSEDGLLSQANAARELGMSRAWVNTLVKSGKLETLGNEVKWESVLAYRQAEHPAHRPASKPQPKHARLDADGDEPLPGQTTLDQMIEEND